MAEIRIKLDQIQEGMIVSRDVYTDADMFLIPTDTIINENHILKMELYQVDSIYIFIAEEEDDQPKIKKKAKGLTTTNYGPPLNQTVKYLEFEHSYEEQVEQIGDTYFKIISTGQVDTEEITKIADDVMSEVKNSGDLFSYMCRLQSKDDVTYTHALNVSILSNIFGKWLHLSDQDIKNLTIAGMLHDIGKTKISDEILKKTSPLTPEEYEEMKLHTVYGYKLIAGTNLDFGIKQAVLMHHEKMNGFGYPLGINWEQVHKYTKIVGIVDAYDAMTSNRPYRKRMHPFHAIKVLEEECYGVLDTEYLYVFLQNIANNYLGNAVRLIDGRIGKIVFIHPQTPSRPLVEVDGQVIDLVQHDNLAIESFI